MMGNTSNIVIGSGTIALASVDLGFTKDGIAVSNEREYVDIMADQLVGLAKKAKSMERMIVRTTLLETTLANMYSAWDLPSGSLGAGFGSSVNEKTLVVTGPAPSDATRTFSFSRVVSIGNSELMYGREEESALEVEFECLKDSSGKFGTCVEA